MCSIKRKIFFLILAILAFEVFAKPKVQEDVDIYELVKTGTAKELYKGLKKSPDVKSQVYGENSDTLIMVALEASRKIDIINLLLNYGVDADAVNENGDTALIYAAKYGADTKILETLITYNAKKAKRIERVAHKNNDGQSALDFASENPKALKVLNKYVEKQKKDKKSKEEEIQEPSLEDSERIEETYEEKLTEAGTEEDTQENSEEELYSEDGELLNKPQDVPLEPPQENLDNQDTPQEEETKTEDAPQENQTTETEVAATQETVATTETAEPTEAPAPTEEQKKPALSKEVQEELIASKEAAQEAIKKRRDPNRRMYLFEGFEAFETYDDSEKETPITQPNAQDKDGRTLLQNAAANDDVKTIERLLKSGANANITDKDSWTALMYAARFAQRRETVAALLKGGADIKAQNRFGITALQIAASFNENAEILDELAKHSTKKALIPSFIAAVGLGRKAQIIEVFFNHGLSPNMVYKGKTPLMYAAQSNTDTDCIKFLLESGADKTYITADKKDAYYFARKNPNLPRNSVFWSLNNSEN